jgi:hypothetical protein
MQVGQRLVRVLVAASDLVGVGLKTAALTCSAFKPEGPGAVPTLKDLRACRTLSLVKTREGGKTLSDGGGAGLWGFFSPMA